MESRDARLHIRLTHKELESIKALSDDTGLSYSQIVRASIHANENNNRIVLVVFDRNTAPAIAREMRKWGHHYNQAVHALNRLAFYAQRGSLKTEDSKQLLEKANANLEEVKTASEKLATEVSSLMDYELVKI